MTIELAQQNREIASSLTFLAMTVYLCISHR